MFYFDYNATTPCNGDVARVMLKSFLTDFGNPSSIHLAGRNALKAVNRAREYVSKLANCNRREIIFTSGATESNNLIFTGLLLSNLNKNKKVIISTIEHKSVLEPARFLKKYGFDVSMVPVKPNGIIDLNALAGEITPDTCLVSVQSANNEVGTIQPIKKICDLCQRAGIYFHTDAAQAFGKIPIDVQAWNCDFASFSSHKMFGPKGIGALYIKGGGKAWPWELPFHGGDQESGLRPGTSNVPGIVGFGEACRLAEEEIEDRMHSVEKVRNYFEQKIKLAIQQITIHGLSSPRLPGTSSIAFHGAPADILIGNMQDICIGQGSACSEGSITQSHVILSMGCGNEVAKETIRFSFSHLSTIQEIDILLERLFCSVIKVRNIFQREKNDN